MFLSVYEFGTLYVGSSSSDCDVLSNFINRLFTEAPSAVIPKIYWKLAPSELHIIFCLPAVDCFCYRPVHQVSFQHRTWELHIWVLQICTKAMDHEGEHGFCWILKRMLTNCRPLRWKCTTVFSLKHRTAKNNSKWECPENCRELIIIEPKCPMWTREFYSASFIEFFASCYVQLSPPSSKTLEGTYWASSFELAKRRLHPRSLLIASMVIKKTTYCGLFHADKQNHCTNYGGTAVFGLPKYRSYALLSTKDDTHQVSVLCM